jgi:hypothetical protein
MCTDPQEFRDRRYQDRTWTGWLGCVQEKPQFLDYGARLFVLEVTRGIKRLQGESDCLDSEGHGSEQGSQ